ncbi:MAG: TIGR00268 family protein, partial [Clostridia bacterium]|nr:TIGR00268 family protein [Clostridia bacterium]
MNTQEKYTALQDYLKSLGSVAVAYSSGVDSTLLLKVAADTLGKDNVIAVTATSPSIPLRERDES